MPDPDLGSAPFDTRLPELVPLLLEHAGAPVFLVDAAQQVVFVNRPMERLTGHRPEARGALASLLAAMHPDASARQLATEAFAALLARGEGRRELEQAVDTWDGGRSLVRWVLCGVKLPEGPAVLAIGRDLTERWKLERWVRMLAQVITRLSDAVFVTDPDGVVLFWGGGARALLGYEPERVVERDLGSLLAVGPDAGPVEALLEDALGEEGVERTVEMRRADGGLLRCSLRGGPVLDMAGVAVGAAFVACPARPVAGAAEGEAAPSEALEEALGRSGQVALVTTDAEGRVRAWNKAAERLGGRGAGRAQGQRVLDEVLVVEDLAWSVVASHLEARGRFQQAKVRVVRPNGTVALASLEAVSQRGPDGASRGALLLLTDHTDQVNMVEELLFAKQGALNATFTEGLVHRLESAVAALVPGADELARAVQTLQRLATMVAEGRGSEQLTQYVASNRLGGADPGTGEGLYELSEGVHQLQRAAQDARHFLDASTEAPRALHLDRELDVALELVGHRLSGRCSVEIRLAALPPVRAIRGPLLRAFCLALMAAADSAARCQSKGRSLVVSGGARDGWVHLCLQDDGEGFGVDVRSRLGDLPYLAQQPGIGALMIGLCREELRAAGGSFELQGAPGAGSRVCMAFPAAGATAARPSAAATGSGTTVLIVEEDDLLRRALERHVAASFATQAAETVGEVVGPLQEHRFAAAVIGFPRPEGYGLRLMRRFAEVDAALYRNTIILVPPGMRRGTRQALNESGAVVLPRDTDTGAIITVLARMLAELG
ncbi:MAG: PAS domain S-box protein [Pseudomonadota bacterium]